MLRSEFNDNFVVISNWIDYVLDDKGGRIFMTIKDYSTGFNRERIKKNIKSIISALHKKLNGRHWCKKPILKFIIFLEVGKFKRLHAHIIINIGRYTYQEIVDCFYMLSRYIKYDIGFKEEGESIVRDKRRYNRDIILSEVYHKEGAIRYCMKELGFNLKHLKSDNIIPYNLIFDFKENRYD